eukprot:4751760-Pleurochrysis_carterae.AAC.6
MLHATKGASLSSLAIEGKCEQRTRTRQTRPHDAKRDILQYFSTARINKQSDRCRPANPSKC